MADPRSTILVVVPVYNHRETLRAVVQGVLAVHPEVLVVDDGSDQSVAPELEGLEARLVRHETNQGKGAAILTAAAEAEARGMTHIVTIDADGQHDPKDLHKFLVGIEADPLAVLVGSRDFETPNVPGASRFGRRFSNFWLRVQTGVALGDVQCGFRAYPVNVLRTLKFSETRYSFEVEVLVKAAWAGFALTDVPVDVHYPPASQRVSHFNKFWDNVRISLLNARLTMRAFVPLPHRQYDGDDQGNVSPIHPMRSLRRLLADDGTPGGLALAAAMGMLLGTLPLIGCHTIAILLVCGYFRLNKLAGLAAGQLCMPPFVPALCIEAGYYLRNGRFLTEVSMQTLGFEFLDRIWEWALGSLVLAPIFALVLGAVVYAMALIVKMRLQRSRGRS